MRMKKEKPSYGGGGKMDMYEGGGKMPMYVLGGKVHKNESSLMEALMKDPKQREKAKKMLGM